MKFERVDPPRRFRVGFGEPITLSDCGHIRLEADEQVTFTTAAGAEYDVTRKSWGFYATPSLNSRLKKFGLRGVLIRNRIKQYFVMLVEKGMEGDFQRYMDSEALEVVAWMDDDESLQELAGRLVTK